LHQSINTADTCEIEKELELSRTLHITALWLFSLVLSISISFSYVYSNHWLLSNIFGIFFSVQGIELLSLGSFFNGFILLIGLFFYDIFWVFGTDVMVTVAKSFDAPIKLLFPQFNLTWLMNRL